MMLLMMMVVVVVIVVIAITAGTDHIAAETGAIVAFVTIATCSIATIVATVAAATTAAAAATTTTVANCSAALPGCYPAGGYARGQIHGGTDARSRRRIVIAMRSTGQ